MKDLDALTGDIATPAQIHAPAGRPGEARQIALSDLVIDPRFQRPIGGAGAALVTQIAARFDWTKFTPLIVAPANGEGMAGKFSIIDGQHRAAAAFLRADIPMLPCWVVAADVKAQSLAFLAINGERTKMHALAIWHARHAGGEEEAGRLFRILAEAGCELARYPMSQARRPAHITMAGSDVMDAVRLRGAEPTRRALTWLREAGVIAGTSLLTRNMIRSAAEIAGDKEVSAEAAIAAFSETNPSALFHTASATAKAEGRKPVDEITRRLRMAIERKAKRVSEGRTPDGASR